MSRSKLYFFALLALMVGSCGCEKMKSQDEPKPADTTHVDPVRPPDMSLIKQEVLVTDNWVWSGKPQITVRIENSNTAKVRLGVRTKILTDSNVTLTTVADSVDVPGKSAVEHVVTTAENLEPGIYRAACFVNEKTVRSFNFAIDPSQIISAPDKQADFDQFWQAAKDQLAAIEMSPNLIELPSKSTESRKVYMVELNSIPDGLNGEPVKIRGYYCEPQDGQKHPVIMHFYGYDTQGTTAKVECPHGNGSDHAEFYLSHRGQYINNRPESSRVPDGLGDLENIYGDWASYHMGDKDSYYYRGAYMDVVQAVRFMATRETSDMTKLCAEGSSQGGALAYVCAALSDYPCAAVAANVAFMCNFAEAMNLRAGLAYWEIKDNQGTMSDEEVLRAMSYFDIKNMASRISCPVVASTGLQDDVCPPRTNITAFNNLATPADKKEMVYCPEMGHSYPANWWTKMNTLFQSVIGN